MKYQVLFSLKNKEKVFINVVCCSRDWCFKKSMVHLGFVLLSVSGCPGGQIVSFTNSYNPYQSRICMLPDILISWAWLFKANDVVT